MGLVTNFTSFAPLGTVLVALLGVGVAERSGLLGAAIRAMVFGAPRNLLTAVVVFAAVVSNTASEMGYVVLIPLAAVVFHSVGRNPLAGLAAAFAGVSGGYSANVLIGTVDPLLSGITTEAAQIIDASYAPGGINEVLPTANYYFMFVSTFLITIVGTLVTTRIVEPKLGPYDPAHAEDGVEDAAKDMGALSADEKMWCPFLATRPCTGSSTTRATSTPSRKANRLAWRSAHRPSRLRPTTRSTT